MKNTHVLISGASIAGPALACWLSRYGFQVTVVEQAPALRAGGQAVDFRGAAHMGVLRRMGVLEEITRLQTHMGEQRIVDASGKCLAALPAAFMSGEVEIQRGDLSRILYDASQDKTEYLFGDQIRTLDESAAGVRVTFNIAAPRRFDLVIGADGLHSGVRALVFGEEAKFLRFCGHYAAGFSLPNDWHLDRVGMIYSELGKAANISCTRDQGQARALLLFASQRLELDRHDVAKQKQLLADVFRGVGWEVPKLIDSMWRANDLYFDSISQIHIEHYSRGRVALLGDAAWGGTLGGQGTGSAMVGAYILAGELAAAHGDYQCAFTNYEQKIRKYAVDCQKGAERVGPFYAPQTRVGLWFRNHFYRLLASDRLAGLLDAMITKSANAIVLQDYAR